MTGARGEDGKVERLKIRDEVAALKRERTVSAAADLFYEEGYERTTLDQVAEVLGVTKPFIYANFSSKGELLAEICARGVQAADDQIARTEAQNLAPRQAMEFFAQHYVLAILQSQKAIAVYTREEKNLNPEDARRLSAMRKGFLDKVAALIARGVESGDFDAADPKIAAFAIVGSVSWSAFWFRTDGRLDPADIARRMTKHILGLVGCAPTAGVAAATKATTGPRATAI